MKKLSSDWTFFTKRVMPAVFFGFLIFAAIGGTRQELENHRSPIPFIAGPLIMSGMFYFMMRRYIFDLVDEVWDAGDTLVVRNRGVEERIELKYLMSVNDMTTANWPRVTLLLREPCRLGGSVSFSPKGGRSFFRLGNPIALELTRKIDALKRRD